MDHLTVRRTDAFPQNGFRFSFPATVVVEDVGAVRRVARALCALPAMPNQAMHCPADFGITYHLVFSHAARRFRPVIVAATGCQSVRGLDEERWAARAAFWRVLGTAMGLAHPSATTFRGSRPSG